MNKKTITTLILLMVASIGYGGESKFRIEGNIGQPNYTGSVLIIDMMTRDTVATGQVENGIMHAIEGTTHSMLLCGIVANDRSFMRSPLYIESGTTQLNGCDSNGELLSSGTPVSDDLNNFKLAIQKNNDEVKNGKRNEEDADSINCSLISTLISKHNTDVLGLRMLTGMASVTLPPAKWLELLEGMSSEFSKNPKLARHLSQEKQKMEICSNTWVGKPYKDFAVEYNGKVSQLSDYVGKGQYVLVDFWASWCGSCREQITDYSDIYRRYKDKGLIVLGIAVKDKPEQTEKLIDELKIAYPQIINAQEIPAKLYGIDALPHTILFAPNGTVCARHIYGDRLKAKIASIFEEK